MNRRERPEGSDELTARASCEAPSRAAATRLGRLLDEQLKCLRQQRRRAAWRSLFERDTIRPRTGEVRDRSWLRPPPPPCWRTSTTRARSPTGHRPPERPVPKQSPREAPRGLNENYGRESWRSTRSACGGHAEDVRSSAHTDRAVVALDRGGVERRLRRRVDGDAEPGAFVSAPDCTTRARSAARTRFPPRRNGGKENGDSLSTASPPRPAHRPPRGQRPYRSRPSRHSVASLTSRRTEGTCAKTVRGSGVPISSIRVLPRQV